MRTLCLLVQVVSAGTLLLTNPSSTLAAQDPAPCPFTNDSVVSPAVGAPVHGYASSNNAPDFESCEFG